MENPVTYKNNKNLEHNKFRILTGISDSLLEIKESKKSGKKLQSLKDFCTKNKAIAHPE